MLSVSLFKGRSLLSFVGGCKGSFDECGFTCILRMTIVAMAIIKIDKTIPTNIIIRGLISKLLSGPAKKFSSLLKPVNKTARFL